MGTIANYAQLNYFDAHPNDRALVQSLLHGFSISKAAEVPGWGNSLVAFHLSPDPETREVFRFDRELLLLRANAPELDGRVLAAADEIIHGGRRNHLDRLVFGVLSNAANLYEFVESQTRDNRQSRIVIPIRCEDALNRRGDEFFARGEFRKHLFGRDLFDIGQAITADHYFFGRAGLMNEIENGVRGGKNFGLFGMRRAGKTSALLKLQRTLEARGVQFLYLDLQDSKLYLLRWWELLDELRRKISGTTGSAATPLEAVRGLESAVVSRRGTPIVVAMDEIEHISPNTRMEQHWERDFLDFWKSLRALQNQNRHVSFFLAGVNASVVETAMFGGQDNPLFQLVDVRYLPVFGLEEVRAMVKTLGDRMGLHFENDAFRYLQERYAGHQHLIRVRCSKLHREFAVDRRPAHVPRSALESLQTQHETAMLPFAEQVLSLLQRQYPDEYELLQRIEANDPTVPGDHVGLTHLRAYGLVSDFGKPSVKLPLVSEALRASIGGIGKASARPFSRSSAEPAGIEPLATSASGNSHEPDWASISALRNRLEPKLRIFLRRTLKAHLGAERWIDPILKAIPTKERERLQGVDRNEILERRLFLLNLVTVVDQNWDIFKSFESAVPERRVTKDQFRVLIEYVNAHREDAHAKPVSGPEIAAVEISVKAIEAAIEHIICD